mmetsp:Transcript_6037/g.9106  ORF Transcript_6037/g.9106 Transcript_6037/m.9106 type:complete len:306 (-) Transcript_6037:379-1296(-)
MPSLTLKLVNNCSLNVTKYKIDEFSDSDYKTWNGDKPWPDCNETTTTTFTPKDGWFGVERGIGVDLYLTFNKDESKKMNIEARVPACGDNSCKVVSNTAGVGVRIHWSGNTATVTFSNGGPTKASGIRQDGGLQAFEALPGVGLGISAGHAIAGEKDQARRAAIKSAATTTAVAVTAASGGTLGVMGGALAGGLQERALNGTIDKAHRNGDTMADLATKEGALGLAKTVAISGVMAGAGNMAGNMTGIKMLHTGAGGAAAIPKAMATKVGLNGTKAYLMNDKLDHRDAARKTVTKAVKATTGKAR